MPADSALQIATVRRFGRFYTRQVGALAEGLLDSPHPLPEARLIFELGQLDNTAGALADRLGMDAGYMSRLVRRLETAGLLARGEDEADGRRQPLRLTAAGRARFAELDAASQAQVGHWLAPLAPAARGHLVQAMATIEALLDQRPQAVALRGLQPGDIGWIVAAHGRLYAQEYGWDWTFEAYVAGACRDFIEGFDSARSAGWIAEAGAAKVGSVLVAPAAAAGSAKLRMVILEPAFRGRGLGRRLVEAAEAFARDAGYRRMELWTFDVLADARALYARLGYACTHREPQHRFGHALVEERWERRL